MFETRVQSSLDFGSHRFSSSLCVPRIFHVRHNVALASPQDRRKPDFHCVAAAQLGDPLLAPQILRTLLGAIAHAAFFPFPCQQDVQCLGLRSWRQICFSSGTLFETCAVVPTACQVVIKTSFPEHYVDQLFADRLLRSWIQGGFWARRCNSSISNLAHFCLRSLGWGACVSWLEDICVLARG